MPVNNLIQLRKGDTSAWGTDPVLASGEPGFDIEKNILKIGDGSSVWSNLEPVNTSLTNFNIYGTGDINLSGNITSNTGNFDQINFNTSLGEPDLSAGQFAWYENEGTLALGISDSYAMFMGEELHYRVRNNTGSTILAGTPVYASGLTPGGNNRIEVAPKVADGSVREIRFMGLMTEDCNTGLNGYTTHFGYIRKIDTRGDATSNGTTNKLWADGEPTWAEGDILYIHPTVAGKLTKIEPKHSISVAIILNRHQNEGKIFVRPTSYGHLDDNHDVAVSGATNGQFLQYNSATDYWVPSSSGNFTTLQVNGTAVPTGVGTTNYLTKWTGTNSIGDSIIYDSGTNVGIGTNSPTAKLMVYATGASTFRLESSSSYASSIIKHNVSAQWGFLEFNNDSSNRAFIQQNGSATINYGGPNALSMYNYAGPIVFGTNTTSSYIERMSIDTTGNIVINEGGLNSDFRVEGDTDANLLFTDASTDRVGIGTASPSHKLDVSGVGRFVHADGDCGLIVEDSGGSGVHIGDCALYGGTYAGIKYSSHTGSEYMLISRGDHTFMSAASGYASIIRGGLNSTSSEIRVNDTVDGDAGVVINNQYADRDVRIHGTGDPYVFYVDASADSVGIGTASPSYKLDVVGTGHFDALNINNEFTFPTTDGSANQYLKTDGNGNVSWASVTGAGGASTISIGTGDVSQLSFDTSEVLNIVASGGLNITFNDATNTITISPPTAVTGYEELTTTKDTFNVSPNYRVGTLSVYYNGFRLINGRDFIATNGTSFVLSETADVGDVVEWVGTT